MMSLRSVLARLKSSLSFSRRDMTSFALRTLIWLGVSREKIIADHKLYEIIKRDWALCGAVADPNLL